MSHPDADRQAATPATAHRRSKRGVAEHCAVVVAGALAIAVFGFLAPSCSGDTKVTSVEDAAVIVMDAQTPDAPARDALIAPARDAEIIVFHDAGGPLACSQTCDCPQGLGCVNGGCRALGAPVYCCNKPNCPIGQACLAENDRPQTCPMPDAGPPPVSCERPDASLAPGNDGGLGHIGQACEFDTDCDQSLGYTCWERYEPPFVWGYCTLAGCVGGCPPNSMCIQFNLPPPDGPITGCMQVCNVDSDCRTDAYCFFIPNGGFSICLPNCRDDVLDCAPRDGTIFCSPITGECEPNMCHAGGTAGDACVDTQDCKEGYVCMTQAGWGFVGGMCTRVCSGLPESQPCDPGTETCQDYAGVGLCFRNCVGGMCPNRANAVCEVLPGTGWPTPSCIAQ